MKKIVTLLAVAILCVSSVTVFAAEKKTEPLPLKPDTTLGDVQEHFTPEVYEEMPEDLKEECDEKRMTDVMRESVSSGKIFGGIGLISIGLLTVLFAIGESKKK